MRFSLTKCFAVVFNSISRKKEDLPALQLGKYEIKSYYPKQVSDLYLGVHITDRIVCTKLDHNFSHPHFLVPNYRSKPNPRYLKRIKEKFNRSRFGIHKLCEDREILTPTISVRLYKTLQRSTLLYAIEICDWDIDQVVELEILQAKAIRSLFDLDRLCPKAVLRLVTGVEPVEARIDLHVLMYYAKLCRSKPNCFLGRIHNHRSTISSDLPVGFYYTAQKTLCKYKIGNLWNNIPDNTEVDLKTLFKKTIWSCHWGKDVSEALKANSFFAAIFLNNRTPDCFPYKQHKLLKCLRTEIFPRNSLSRVLRFWLTSPRERVCPCGGETNNLSLHLLFFCDDTRDLRARYTAKLPSEISKMYTPNTIEVILRVLTNSAKLLEDFNLMICKFEYPRY